MGDGENTIDTGIKVGAFIVIVLAVAILVACGGCIVGFIALVS